MGNCFCLPKLDSKKSNKQLEQLEKEDSFSKTENENIALRHQFDLEKFNNIFNERRKKDPERFMSATEFYITTRNGWYSS